MSALRRRLEHSNRLAHVLAWLARGYLRFCNATTRWQVTGLDDLRADLAQGPVLLVTWHGRLLMAPMHWPLADGPLSSLYAASPIGRVSGAMQRQFGLQAMEMAEGQSNLAASRQILRRVRSGVSIGLTGDGPLGPARQMKDAPLDWAGVMGRPLYGYAFATARHRTLKSWDAMMLPLPFTTGSIVFDRFAGTVPRKTESGEQSVLRQDLGAWLDRVTDQADAQALGPQG